MVVFKMLQSFINLESAKAVMFVDPLCFGFFTEIYSDFIFIFITVNPKKQRKVFPGFIPISRSYNVVLFQ